MAGGSWRYSSLLPLSAIRPPRWFRRNPVRSSSGFTAHQNCWQKQRRRYQKCRAEAVGNYSEMVCESLSVQQQCSPQLQSIDGVHEVIRRSYICLHWLRALLSAGHQQQSSLASTPHRPEHHDIPTPSWDVMVANDSRPVSIARVYRPFVARVIEPPCGPLDGLLSPLGLRVNHLLSIKQRPVW